MANWTSNYGSFLNFTGFQTVGHYVIEVCDGGGAEWNERMEITGAFERIESEYYAAINDALPHGVHLVGDEFIGPADGELNISELIESIDFWAILEKHDVDNVHYTIVADTAAQAADEIRQAVTTAESVELNGTTLRFDSAVYRELHNAAYDKDEDGRTIPYIHHNQLTTSHGSHAITTRNSSVSSPQDVTTTVDRPTHPKETNWDWAEAATEAWLDAARGVGILIEEEDLEPEDPTREAARVKVEGTWYALRLGGDPRDLDKVRAIPTD